MRTMTELISWFQLKYPLLVEDMKLANHHYLHSDDGGANDDAVRLNPYHLESDVFTHTMMVCKQAENAPYEVQVAALLHDIGKPSTRSVNPKNGRVSFYNHDAVSAFMSLEILKREELGLSKEQQVKIFNMIALHTQVYKLSVDQLAAIGDLDLVEGLIELGKADHAGRFHTAGDAVIPSIDDIKRHNEVLSGVSSTKRGGPPIKDVIVLCGLPASGKSTWVHNHKRKVKSSFIISRDAIISDMLPELSYNEAWKNVNQKTVDKELQELYKESRVQSDTVIIDMTHMSKKSRRKSLSHFGPEYKKKCVVFLTDMQTLCLRNENRCGKIIDKKVIDKMMRSFYPPTYEEFDEIEYVI